MAETGLRQVVVAGGTGLVGRHLAAALAGGGTGVTVLSRAPGTSGWPPGIQARNWDDLPGALEGADAVINLCGAGIADRRWTASRKQVLLDSRVGPTARLVRDMAACGTPVLVNASAVGIYGALDETPVDEAQAPGRGFLATLCRQWEAAADGAADRGARVVKLRLGVVLAGDGGALPRMAFPVRMCLGARLGSGRQGLSWIHVDDLVRLIIEAAAHPACQGPVNATAPMPVSNEAFTKALARRLKRPVWPMPAFATRLALGVLLGEMGEAVLLEGAFVHPRVAERLGFEFKFPGLEEALADLIRG
jgi:uncharacterized protein (TIGR01777 family)